MSLHSIIPDSEVQLLPDLDLRCLVSYNPNRRGAATYLKRHVGTIPEAVLFCGFRIMTRAKLQRNPESAGGTSHGIPVHTRYSSLAALDLATALLSQEAERYGWYFHLPEWFRFDRNNQHPLHAEFPNLVDAEERLRQLAESAMESESDMRDMMMAEGARHRRAIYAAEARNPNGYVLGVRVQYK